jgi:uncharacterized protein (DUF362 family)
MKQKDHFFSYLKIFLLGIASLIWFPYVSVFAALTPNTPVGVAKGVNPGRVVWMHDTSATPWKGLGDGHWWQGSHTSQVTVDQMMSRSLRTLSGKLTDGEAWDTLFRYYNITHQRGNKGYAAGEKIAIKTNFTFCNFFPVYCCVDSMTYSLYRKLDYMNTAPHMVRALLRQLVNIAGVSQADIAVGDPVAYYPNEFYDSCHAEFPNVHYIDHAGKFGRTKAEFSTVPMYWSCRPSAVKQDFVARHYAEASYLINLANMKSHMGNGITLCAKNHYGSFIRLPTDSGYYDLHQSLPFMTPAEGSYRSLVDIIGHASLGGKTLLYLIDGLYAGNHNNDTVPHTWPVPPFNGGWTSSLFASQDPVAIESVLFDLFQLDTDPFQYPKIPGVTDYLNEAALANNPPSGTFYDPNHATATERLQSLGVFEHWNNPADRKYSRNLGTGSGIELVFIDGTSTRIRSMDTPTAGRSLYLTRVAPTSGTVQFTVPKKGQVVLSLYDCRGRLVNKVVDSYLNEGKYQVKVIPEGKGTMEVAPGVYTLTFFILENGKTIFAVSCRVPISGK